MKKLLVACCALCCFTGFAMADADWCGLKCGDSTVGKYFLCLTTDDDGDFGVVNKCGSDGWEYPVIDWCAGTGVPNGWQAVGRGVAEAAYVTNDVVLFSSGTTYNPFVEVQPSQICLGCKSNYHFDDDHECVPNETSEEFCGAVCDASHEGKFAVCDNNSGGTEAGVKKCEAGNWSDQLYNTKYCDPAVPSGYGAVGGYEEGYELYVKNSLSRDGNVYWISSVAKENICWGCKTGYRFDGGHNCVVDETGGVTATEFCGVKCEGDNKGKIVVCPGSIVDIKKCFDDGTWYRNEDTVAGYCNDKMEAPKTHIYKGLHGDLGLLVWVNKKAKKAGSGYIFDDSAITNYCLACRVDEKWDDVKKECVKPKTKPTKKVCDPNDPICNENPRTSVLGNLCDGDKKEYDYCEPERPGVEGRCRDLAVKKSGTNQMTCAATKCDDGYLLWLDRNGESQGQCHSVKYVYDFCAKGCGCGSDEKCVPWIVDTPSVKVNGRTFKPKKDGAYQECHCEKKSGVVVPDLPSCKKLYPNNPKGFACCEAEKSGVKIQWNEAKTDCTCLDPKKQFNYETQKCETKVVEQESDCVYNFSGTVLCPDGKKYNIEYHKKLPQSVLNDTKIQCTELNKRFSKDVSDLQVLANFLCTKKNDHRDDGRVPPKVNRELELAIQDINKFFEITNSHKNVWRDEDGKFNTTRLASDATAGVVLGTVGGIVSSKIIKKKQLEKGYDALQCTVGGQKIADYGDTFRVSFYR